MMSLRLLVPQLAVPDQQEDKKETIIFLLKRHKTKEEEMKMRKNKHTMTKAIHLHLSWRPSNMTQAPTQSCKPYRHALTCHSKGVLEVLSNPSAVRNL